MEIWRDVPGQEGRYAVSNLGRMTGLRGLMSGSPNKKGYIQVGLYSNGKRKLVALSRLILIVFVGPPPTPKHEADHRDGVKAHNALSNLRWVTGKENVEAAHELGLIPLGEESFAHVLTWDQVRAIRQEYRPRTRGRGRYSLARKYGVWPTTVDAILKRRTWKHDPAEIAA